MGVDRDGLRGQMADWLDLPRDVVLDVPRITLIGDVQLAVENHRGLLEYNSERIAVGTPGGRLAVTGRDLVIGTVSGEAITVRGRIEALRFEPA